MANNNPLAAEQTPKPKTSVKSVIILMLVSILFAVLLIEVVTWFQPQLVPRLVRIFFIDDDLPRFGLTPDPYLGFKFRPNLTDFPVPFRGDDAAEATYPLTTISLGYDADAIGFRDDGLDGPVDTLVLGDSFAACAGVADEDCWVELLEQQTGQDFTNLGVIGYGPQVTYRLFTKYGLPLQPRRVLWVVYANDHYDAYLFSQFGKSGAREGEFWQNPARAWLLEHSSTFMVLAFFWYNRPFFSKWLAADSEGRTTFSNLIWWETITDPANPARNQGLQLSEQAILDAQAALAAQSPQAEFIVLLLPTREQVYLENAVLKDQLDALSAEMVDFANQHNIPVINLAPELTARAKSEPFLYYLYDIHLNERGNEVVAELLEPYLAQQ